MAGIEISDEVTPSQLEAMAGGELLKAEVQHNYYYTNDELHFKHHLSTDVNNETFSEF